MRKKIDALLDSLYLAESMSAYSACVMTQDLDAAQALQASWYQLPGLPFTGLEIALFIGYATISKLYRPTPHQQHSWLIKAITLSWPYFRDFISGLKNGRHAVINVSFLIQHTAQQAVYHIANPVGIIVGIVLALVLTWYRSMSNTRLQAIADNTALYDNITNVAQIKRHTWAQRLRNYCAAGFDGLTDGLYLYGCLFLLIGVGLTPATAGAPLILAVCVITTITLVSFIAKMHDEYLAQQALEASALKCEIKLLTHEPDTKLPLHGTSKLIKKIAQHQQVYETLVRPTTPQHFSFIGKAIFFTGRGILSGAKNAVAALNSIKAMIPLAILTILITVSKPLIATGYAIYLGIKSIETEYAKRKFDDKLSFFQNDLTASTKPLEYWRNNFV